MVSLHRANQMTPNPRVQSDARARLTRPRYSSPKTTAQWNVTILKWHQPVRIGWKLMKARGFYSLKSITETREFLCPSARGDSTPRCMLSWKISWPQMTNP